MARKAEGLARKGSQKWLQKVVNETPNVLNAQIISHFDNSEDETVTWFSPLVADDFAEYQDQAFLDRLQIKLPNVSLKDFWPTRGPVWDGLARSASGKVFLIEAKSHIPEIVSPGTAAGQKSLALIQQSLAETKIYLGVKAQQDWSASFYQYTNRLAHLYLLRALNDIPAYLVFVHFVNDVDMNGPESRVEWIGAIKLLHSYLGIGRHKLSRYIVDAFVDVQKDL